MPITRWAMVRTEHAVWMRAMEPCRVCIRSGCGSLSRILDCSVEGPRGAKPCVSGKVDATGEGGRESPLPSPSTAVSARRRMCIKKKKTEHALEEVCEWRVFEYNVLHRVTTACCTARWWCGLEGLARGPLQLRWLYSVVGRCYGYSRYVRQDRRVFWNAGLNRGQRQWRVRFVQPERRAHGGSRQVLGKELVAETNPL
jgi:hypothetical protein